MTFSRCLRQGMAIEAISRIKALDYVDETTRKHAMNDPVTISLQEGSDARQAVWRSESGAPPPQDLLLIDDSITADAAYWRACAGTAMLYSGDFQNARQLLNAVTRRASSKEVKPTENLRDAFHQHRSRQINRANITNKILIELKDGECEMSRSPALKEPVERALGHDAPAEMVLSLREVMGMVGANQWYRKGVPIDALDASIHAGYGVFSPVRGEYLELIQDAPLNEPKVAWDIGTGTGVIAAILASRGVPEIVATDNCKRAILCAAENFERLKIADRITLSETDLFPDGSADLIVCNPPWLPAKANTPIERAIYDPKSRMLRTFLQEVGSKLNDGGEVWLVMSNLAELIGLRGEGDLLGWIEQSQLEVVERMATLPKHPKSKRESDPLHDARRHEVTSLYRLQTRR